MLHHALTPSRIVIAETASEKEAIYRLRYEVYIDEMGGGTRHDEADASTRQLRDELDDTAYHFYAVQDEQVVACARLNMRKDGPLECEPELEMDRFAPAYPAQVSMSSRMVIHPTLRGSHVLMELACAMYRFKRDQEIRFDFIDCHPRLLPLYSRLGYRIYKPGFTHPKYVYVVPMVLVTDDLAYLEQVRSPYIRHAKHRPHSTAGRALLSTQFPESARTFLHPDVDADAFWTLMRTRLLEASATAERSELLAGLTEREAQALLRLGHVIGCRADDVVLSSGDQGRELFVILNGSFVVLAREPQTHSPSVVKILVPGDVFGEVGFLTEGLRGGRVTAMEEAKILVLNARAIDRLTKTTPSVAAKVFRNLARIVAIRLRDTAGF
jgi:CRP-like cAMP-binding protein/predicted GNAT family N-acyltransferase